MSRPDRDLTSEEARQAGLMESVLRAPLEVPPTGLLADLAAELVDIGLLVEEDGRLVPSPAAVHYGELLDHVEHALSL